MGIAEPSLCSLMLEMLSGDEVIARGTGFVVNANEQPYLVTNRHNMIGRDADNQPLGSGAIPTEVAIWHSVVSQGSVDWTRRIESLYIEYGSPRWLEHPQLGKQVDVVALPLRSLDEVTPVPYDPTLFSRSRLNVEVTADVFIVGFPFNLAAGGAASNLVERHNSYRAGH